MASSRLVPNRTPPRRNRNRINILVNGHNELKNLLNKLAIAVEVSEELLFVLFGEDGLRKGSMINLLASRKSAQISKKKTVRGELVCVRFVK